MTHFSRATGVLLLLVACGALFISPAQAKASPPHLPTHWLGQLRFATAAEALDKASLPGGHFPFQTRTSPDGMVILHYYNQPDSFATQIMQLVTQVIQHPIHDTLGFSLKRTVNIFVYNSRDDFLQGASPDNPAETGAYTITWASQVFLPITDVNDLETVGTLSHELTHVVFHQNEDVTQLQSDTGTYPLWLDEGLAAYDESVDPQAVRNYNSALSTSIANKSTISLLDDFNANYPADPDVDNLGYAEARSFIEYLMGVFGPTAFHQFLASIRNGDLVTAAIQYFHATPRVLQQRWEIAEGIPISDVGYAPVVVAPIPFASGTLPGRASSTQPFPLPHGASIAQTLLLIAIILTILLGIVVGLEFLWIRGKRQPDQATITHFAPITPTIDSPGYGANMPQTAPDASVDPVPSSAQSPAPAGIVLPFQPRTADKPPTALHWSDIVAMVAPPLVVYGIGIGWVQLTPRHEWGAGAMAAGITGTIWAMILLAKVLQLRSRNFNSSARIIGLSITFVTLMLYPFVSAGSLGTDQANGYQQQGAFALSLQSLTDSGQPQHSIAMANIHIAWGNASYQAHDYGTSITQFRDAEVINPTDSKFRSFVQMRVEDWGNLLRDAGQYNTAVQAYQAQQHFAQCDAACQQAMTADLATTYRAWGDALLGAGDFAGAQQKYQILQQSYGTTLAGKQTANAGREAAGLILLGQAWHAGQQGDYATMNGQLQTLTHQYSDTIAATESAQTPELVTGTIRDSSGYPVAGDQIFFLAFTQRADAISFHYNQFSTVVSTVGAGGSYSVHLQPGYWYVPFWGDASLAADRVNTSLAGDLSAFYLQPYTTRDLGTIVGF